MTFSCGCTDDGKHCRAHADFLCHQPRPETTVECPPCRLERLRSIGLAAEATPTRRR